MPTKKLDALAFDGECYRCGAPEGEYVLRGVENPLLWRIIRGKELSFVISTPREKGMRLEKITLNSEGLFCRSCIGREDRFLSVTGLLHKRKKPCPKSVDESL